MLRSFYTLSTWCQPRVMATYLRTVWGGWVTDSRMKGLIEPVRPCVLGCGCGDDDVKHYTRCAVFWEFASKSRPSGLGITTCTRSAEASLLVAEGMSEEDKVRMALGLYALYRVVQIRRHNTGIVYQTMPLLKIWTRRAADSSGARALLKTDWR